MKTWMTPQTKNKNSYIKKTLISMFIWIVLILALFAGTLYLIMFKIIESQYKNILIFACWFLIIILIVFFTWRLGRILGKETMLFCKDDEGHLYVIDASKCVWYGHRILISYYIQKKLTELKQQLEENILPEEAIEILKVKVMRERSDYYSLVCQVRFHNGRTGKRTYIFWKGYENEDELIYLLEKKRLVENLLEIKDSKTRIYALLSLLALILFVILCICSHPYFSLLPQVIYFPCLAIAFITLLVTIYLMSAWRRGE